jgi:hypothetical protein
MDADFSNTLLIGVRRIQRLEESLENTAQKWIAKRPQGETERRQSEIALFLLITLFIWGVGAFVTLLLFVIVHWVPPTWLIVSTGMMLLTATWATFYAVRLLRLGRREWPSWRVMLMAGASFYLVVGLATLAGKLANRLQGNDRLLGYLTTLGIALFILGNALQFAATFHPKH